MSSSSFARMKWICWIATIAGLIAAMLFLKARYGTPTAATQHAVTLIMMLLWLVALFIGMATVLRGGENDRTQIIQGVAMVLLANAVMLVNAAVMASGPAPEEIVTPLIAAIQAPTSLADATPGQLIELTVDKGDLQAANLLAEKALPEVQGVFLDILADPARTLELRLVAARALSTLCRPTAAEKADTVASVDALADGLKDPRMELAKACAEALGRTRSERAADFLAARLPHPDISPALRIAAVQALGQLGNPRGKEPILALLGDNGTGDPALDEACRKAIVLIEKANPTPPAAAPATPEKDAAPGEDPSTLAPR